MELLTSQNFVEKINKGVVFVDFYAEWCMPCQALKPYLEGMSQDYAGKITFYKVDVDQSWDIAMTQWVRAMPTLKLYVDGQVQDTIVGADLEKIHTVLAKYSHSTKGSTLAG